MTTVRTHSEECWKWHHECAIYKIEQNAVEIERLRELHRRNLHDARAYRADPAHRCDWRVRIEAIESRSKEALVKCRHGEPDDDECYTCAASDQATAGEVQERCGKCGWIINQCVCDTLPQSDSAERGRLPE